MLIRKYQLHKKNKDADQLHSNCTPDKCPCFCYIDSKIPPYLNQKFQASSYLVVVQPDLCQILSETPNIVKTCPCNVTCNPLTPHFYMSLVMRKPAFCICENKDAEQLCGNREADQRLCFRYTDTTIPLLPKSEISSH